MRRGARSLHRHRAALVACAALAVLALAACSDSEEGAPQIEASPTPTPLASEATPTPTVSATRTPTPTSTPVEVLNTLLLIEAETGESITLAECRGPVYGEHFDGASVVWGQSIDGGGGERRQVDLDGERVPVAADRCRANATGVVLDGVPYDDVSCGPISSDGRFMAFTTEVSQDGEFQYGYGVVDLTERRSTIIREDMVHCGGCDSRYGPAWSASGRYLVLAEFGGEGRIFLADTSTMTDRVLGEGNDRTQAPEWSPTEDALALSDQSRTILIDPGSGAEREIPFPWPARWDPTGAYLYSPAWAGAPETRVLEMETLSVDYLPGSPPDTHLWTDAVAVMGLAGGGYTAALEGAPGCDGVTITSPLADGFKCVEGGSGAAISPDGSQVALAQFVEEVGPSEVPRQVIVRQRVLIVDVATGAEREVTDQVLGRRTLNYPAPADPPAITCNEAGTHLLVRWPAAYGI